MTQDRIEKLEELGKTYAGVVFLRMGTPPHTLCILLSYLSLFGFHRDLQVSLGRKYSPCIMFPMPYSCPRR